MIKILNIPQLTDRRCIQGESAHIRSREGQVYLLVERNDWKFFAEERLHGVLIFQVSWLSRQAVQSCITGKIKFIIPETSCINTAPTIGKQGIAFIVIQVGITGYLAAGLQLAGILVAG